jgi:hypothetical protein
MNLGVYFQPSWIAPGPAALLFGVLVGLVVLSYAWHVRVSFNSSARAGWLRRYGSLLLVLVGPALVLAGTVIVLFPVGVPESLVLTSNALPNQAVKRTPRCFDADFDALVHRKTTVTADAACQATDFNLSDTVLDAGPVARRALTLFEQNTPLTSEQLSSRDDAVVPWMRKVVVEALTDTAPVPVLKRPEPPNRAIVARRWITEAIETAVIEGLSQMRNVRNVAVERYIVDGDSVDEWKMLQQRLSLGIGAFAPAMHLSTGSPISSEAYVSFFNPPWLQRSGGKTTIYAMLLKGPKPVAATFGLRSADGSAIPFDCGGPVGDTQRVRDCVSDFDAWDKAPGTTRLAVLNADGRPAADTRLDLAIAGTSVVVSMKLRDETVAPDIAVAGDPDLVATLACLAGPGLAPPLTDLERPRDGAPRILPGRRGSAAVEMVHQNGQIWVYPEDIDQTQLTALMKEAKTSTETPVTASDQPLAGLWLFPYLARSDGLGPGVGQMLEAPLTAVRPGAPAQPTTDPVKGVSAPQSLWLPRYDARPVVFAYAMDNYVRYAQRVSSASPVPIGWRIDLAAGRAKDSKAVVWVFQIDLARQGLLLDSACQPIGDRAAVEPAYDSARFVPFWSTLFDAIATSAEPGDRDPILTAASSERPIPVVMDDATRRLIHMHAAGFGILLVVAGMLIHAVLMIWFRFSASRRP